MERFKRAVSLVLCMVMVLGFLPVSVFAATGDTHYLMFATDRHTNTSIIGNIINNMESNIGENKLEYLALGGDMVGSGSNHPEYKSSTVLSEATGATTSLSAANVDIVAGIHDMNVNDDAGIVLPYQGGGAQIYAGDGYYVYGVEEYCISEDSNESNWSTQAQAFVDWANGDGIDKSAVIFVSSHYPLHANRDDNDGAYYWHQALNTVATGGDSTVERDIVFFHGHNHTVDKNEYVYNVGDTMSIQNGSSTTSDTIYYTYATAGYLNQNSKATLVTLTDEQIVLEKYTTSGSGTAMTTVTRAVTEETVTLSSIAISGTTEYTVGDELALTVTATYSDGTTADVTADAAITGYDMSTAGTYTVTASYEGKTAAATITVAEAPAPTEEATEPTVPETTEPSEAAQQGVESDTTVPGYDNTVTTTVWKLTSTIETGKTYLIVNTNAASTSAHAMGHSDANVADDAVVVYNDGTNTYILDSDVDSTSKWTFEGSSGSLTPKNGDYYLTYTFDEESGWLGSTTYSNFALAVNTTAYTWATDGNNLRFQKGSSNRYGLTYSNGWTLGEASRSGWSYTYPNVYFYAEETITTGSSAPDTTYHMDLTVDGNTVSNHAYTVTGVENGTRVQMNALYTATANGTSTTVDAPSGGSYTVLSSSNEAVAAIGNDGVLTFTGVEGETLVQVEYTWTVNGVEYKTRNYVVVTAKRAAYGMSITDPSSTQMMEGATLDLEAVVTRDSATVADPAITWSSNDESVATVDANGVVTAKKTGNVIITASYTDPYGNVHTDTVDLEVTDAVYTLALHKANYTFTAVSITEFAEGVTYYIKNEDGTYSLATEYISGNQYYTASASVGEEITAPIAIKGVEKGDTYSIWAVIKRFDGTSDEGTDVGDVPDDQIEWISSDPTIATVDPATGIITFTGKDGTVTITALYKNEDGKILAQDSVVISVTQTNYTVPGDGTDDFPNYPDEGAIRFDKNATAVGNFSQTGVAKVELSMTGVPYSEGSEIDVMVMLDMTGSMSTNGMTAAEEATVAFVEKIVKNEDGSYNENRVAVYAFNSGSSSPYELVSLDSITSDDALATASTAIRTASDKKASGGTPFDEAAKQCYDVLQAAKTDGTGNDRQQFCVFMSDGGPTTYYGSDEKTYYGGNNNSGDALLTSCMSGYSSSDSSDWSFTLPSEYYTDLLKADGVTVYTVGLLLQTAPSNPAPYSSMTDSTYDSTTDTLTTIGSHYFFCSSILKQMASDESKYIDIFNVDNASKATAAFEAIAKSIREAARDVIVADQITDEYTMIFDIPTGSVDIGETLKGQEFYIEVMDYPMTAVYDTDGKTVTDYVRGTGTSLIKLYLGKSNGTYYAASDASGTKFADPVFGPTAIGTMFYWTTDTTDTGISVTVDGTTYHFDKVGASNKDEDFDSTKWFNMTSGAYASGTVNSTNTSTDLIIATPYFVYNAATKMLYWTAEKLSSNELAISYFLYLDRSATEIGKDIEVDAGTYPTNVGATITYTNFHDNRCQQEFPIPQLTWKGAQVSYVFYLVNKAGQPVNRAGRVVPFSEAVYVTDVYTHSVVWNNTAGITSLNAAQLAEDIVPDVYDLYDTAAYYEINVYQTTGNGKQDHFIIEGSSSVTKQDTTKVFNVKSDAEHRYDDYGAYSNVAGTYKSTQSGTSYTANVVTDFDYCNTTVAFAVVWTQTLKEDVVVVDYGLDVVINVSANDAVASGVVGVRSAAPAGVTQDTATYEAARAQTAAVTLGTGSSAIAIGTAKVENLTSVRFSLNKDSGMEFNDAAVFYYEAEVNYYKNNLLTTDCMYSKVTVIPATTIYYEDDFVTYESFNWDYGTNKWTAYNESLWTPVGSTVASEQAQDRPGAQGNVTIGSGLDADNIYGYDGAYANMDLYSNGSAMMATVDYDHYAQASFDFWGTGFDIISLTSNTTGTILVDVYGYNTNGEMIKTPVGTYAVDTYYGYDIISYLECTYTCLGFGEYTMTYDAEAKEWVMSTGYTLLDERKADETAPDAPADGDTYHVYYPVWTITKQTEVEVKGEDGQRPADSKAVKGGSYVVYKAKMQLDVNDPDALYQIPVMKVEGMDYGHYKAVIKATYESYFDHTEENPTNATGSYDFYLDAIRIYDPANNGEGKNEKVLESYEKDHEAYPRYFELRNAIIDSGTFDYADPNNEISGIVYIDGVIEAGDEQTSNVTTFTSCIRDYLKYGPNNELYLSQGQAVSFKFDIAAINAALGEDETVVPAGYEIDKVHIGLKTVTGTKATVKMYDAADTKAADITGKVIDTATDMYYDITDLLGSDALVIFNAAGDGILSVTDIKVTYKTADASAASVLSVADEASDSIFLVSPELARMAVDSIMAAPGAPEMPEPPVEPELFTPGVLSVKVNKNSVKEGQKVKVTVNTSNDVTRITVNGELVTVYKNIKGSVIRVWTVELVARSDTDQMQIDVVAYNADNAASESVSTMITVRKAKWSFDWIR